MVAATAHYQFETLHPFNDGNGRLGRLLVVVQLLRSGVLSEPILSVSPWFETRRAEYQDRLAAVSAEGDWDAWIGFFADGLAASAVDTAQRVDALLALQKGHVRRLNESGATGVVRDIAESLIAYPFVTIASVALRTGRTYPAVNAAIRRLVDLGILRESTGRNYRRLFEAPEVLEVLLRPALRTDV